MGSFRDCGNHSYRTPAAYIRIFIPPLILVIQLIEIGCSGFPEEIKSKNTAEKLFELYDYGFRAFELKFLRSVELSESESSIFKNFSNKFSFSAHGPYQINLGATKEKRISESINWILKASEALEKIGGNILVFHPGYYAVNKEETSKRIKGNLERALTKIESEGIDIKLGIETTAKKKQFGSLEEIKEVCEYLNYEVLPVLDFAHIHARTHGGLKNQKSFEDILERFRGKLDKFHLHIACVKHENGEEVTHQSLKTKEPDYSSFISSLKSKKIDSTLILESPEPLRDLKILKSWISG